MELPKEDYTQYSDKDLQDLMTMHENVMAHYEMMLKQNLKNGDRFSVELHMKYLKEDMVDLQKEIQQRKDK